VPGNSQNSLDATSASTSRPTPQHDPPPNAILLKQTVLLVRDPTIEIQAWEDACNSVMLATLAATQKDNEDPTPNSNNTWFTSFASTLSKVTLWKRMENFSFVPYDGPSPVTLSDLIIECFIDQLSQQQLQAVTDALLDQADSTDKGAFRRSIVIIGYIMRGQSGPHLAIVACRAEPEFEPDANMLTTPIDLNDHIVNMSTAKFEHISAEYAQDRPKGALREQVKQKLDDQAFNFTNSRR
jgi:hypothetical protein